MFSLPHTLKKLNSFNNFKIVTFIIYFSRILYAYQIWKKLESSGQERTKYNPSFRSFTQLDRNIYYYQYELFYLKRHVIHSGHTVSVMRWTSYLQMHLHMLVTETYLHDNNYSDCVMIRQMYHITALLFEIRIVMISL